MIAHFEFPVKWDKLSNFPGVVVDKLIDEHSYVSLQFMI